MMQDYDYDPSAQYIAEIVCLCGELEALQDAIEDILNEKWLLTQVDRARWQRKLRKALKQSRERQEGE